MDGLGATKKILGHPDLKHTPVATLTSYAMQGDEEKALEAGCKDYITKAIDTKNFVNLLANYI